MYSVSVAVAGCFFQITGDVRLDLHLSFTVCVCDCVCVCVCLHMHEYVQPQIICREYTSNSLCPSCFSCCNLCLL